jgi:hypothetical protein
MPFALKGTRIHGHRGGLGTGSNFTPDVSGSNTLAMTLNGNTTINAPTNPVDGLHHTFLLIQDGTGGWTVTWDPIFKHAWSNTGNTAGKQSAITFVYNGTNWIQVGAQGPYVG